MSDSPSNLIKLGDRVTITTPHGHRRTGHVVMKSSCPGAWVLNLGGAHGTPGIATDDNIIQVNRKGRLVYGFA